MKCSWPTIYWFNIYLHYKMITMILSGNIQSYCHIIEYILYAVLSFLPYVFENRSFYLLITFTYFVQYPTSASSGHHPLCSLFLRLCFSFVSFVHLFVLFFDSKYQWKSYSSCVSLISLCIIPFSSIHVAANSKILFFLWLSNIP